MKGNAGRLLLLGMIVGMPFLFLYNAPGKDSGRMGLITVAEPSDIRSTPGVTGGASGANEASGEAIALQESFVRIADKVKPAVVHISTIVEERAEPDAYEFFFGAPDERGEIPGDLKEGKKTPAKPRKPRKVEGTASGVIIDPAGYVLTNEHVVRGAKEIRVTLQDKKRYAGTIVGKDARTDIAIIKIKSSRRFPFARLGDSTRVRVGEWAVAIGSPFGLEETVTTGIVSAVRQSLSIEGRDYRDLIQTDAAINRGNSGGPLINVNGEVIGINTAIYAPTGVFTGIGFAIPINGAKEILNDLMYRGKVMRGWLGVEIRSVDGAIVRQFNLPDGKGILINDVLKGSPADKAGLKRGDVIREFDGKSIADMRGLQDLIRQAGPRKHINIGIVRDGGTMMVALRTGEMPPEEGEDEAAAEPEQEAAEPVKDPSSVQWGGMSVTTCSDTLARRFGVPDREKGCLVLSVDPGSIASDMGILPGDLVRSVNMTATADIAVFEAVTKKLQAAQGIVFDVSRQGRPMYLSYEDNFGK